MVRWPSLRGASPFVRPQPLRRGECGSAGEVLQSIQQALWEDKAL